MPEYWISRVDRGLKPGQVDTAQPVDGSGSHGWCGVALLWLHDSVLGVNVASPGGARMSAARQRSGWRTCAAPGVCPRCGGMQMCATPWYLAFWAMVLCVCN